MVQVPSILPRLVELPSEKGRAFILQEALLSLHLGDLFELHDIDAAASFRVTRTGDLSIDEEAEDLLIEIQQSIKKRKRGKPVRLELSATATGSCGNSSPRCSTWPSGISMRCRGRWT